MTRLTGTSKFVYLFFLIAGWSVGGMIGRFLLPILDPALSFYCRPLGAIVGLLFVHPVMGIKTKWGYLGATGAVLLAILVSCGASSVEGLARLSKETVLAYRLESGDASVAAEVCIFENQYKMGLLSREETDKLCGYGAPTVEGETPSQVPKPSILLFVWELGKLILIGVIAVLVFGRGVMPWKKEVEPSPDE